MSRNRKIRNLADMLPPTVREEKSGILPVNHFRTMKEIEARDGKDAVQKYIHTIFTQEEQRLAEIERKQARIKAIVQWVNIILGTVAVLSLIKFISWLL